MGYALLRNFIKGFTLIELMIYLAIASTGLIYLQERAKHEVETRAYRALGNEIAQYNNAIRSRISLESTLPLGNYTGTAWLKDGTCGGSAPQPYLPCSHPDTTTVGGYIYDTEITMAGGLLATTTIGPVIRSGVKRGDLSGLAAVTANGFQTNYFSPTSSTTFYGFTSNATDAIITAIASTSSNLDAWLRIDGSNQMQHDLSFNPSASNRNINNVDTINAEQGRFTSDLRAPVFRDTDNPTNRYVDPSGNSLLQELMLASGELRLADTLDNKISASGPMGITSNGDLSINTEVGGGDVIIGGAGGSGNLHVDDIFLRGRNNWLSDITPNIVLKQSFQVFHDSIIPKPECPNGGLQRIYMSDQVTMTIRYTGTFHAARATAIDVNPNAWQAVIGSYGLSGFRAHPNAWAIAKTACFYI